MSYDERNEKEKGKELKKNTEKALKRYRKKNKKSRVFDKARD